MVKRLVVYGILGMALAIVLSRQYTVDRPDAEMVVIVNPVNPLNPVVRNPYQEEYEKLLYPVVRISSPSGVGSGVVISRTEIYILTAAHVVENESEVDIEFYPGISTSCLRASVVITDTAKDLALLCVRFADASQSLRGLSELCGEGIYSAQLASKDYQYFLFSPVYAVGCSLGLSPRPSSGILSALSASVVEITAPILPGNSGGPVYDARTYEVIGIAVWVKVYDGQLITTMAGIVPINEIYKFLETTNGH